LAGAEGGVDGQVVLDGVAAGQAHLGGGRSGGAVDGRRAAARALELGATNQRCTSLSQLQQKAMS
jgi:hypothetical protein